jgi:hypothetical protein
MGMFDTVHITCPKCNETIEEQTKSGVCMLDDYTLENVPMDALQGILGSVFCYHCKTDLAVELVTKPEVIVRIADED